MSSTESIKIKLSRNASRVERFIEETLKPGRPEILYEASMHLISAGGKRLRPYLVAKSCEIVGGDPEEAIPFAAALEVLHNFTLVHDDIMDNDDTRRGAPTVHAKWGVPIAIAAGDLLFAKVYEIMTKNAPGDTGCEKIMLCVEKVTEASISICKGQVLDVSYPSTEGVSEEDYFFMVGGKTSALFRACAEIGAIIGGGSPEQVGALGRFAWDAGIAFQLVDDYLGATAVEEELGKPVGSDLREGKKTLIIIHALSHASPEQRSKILGVLGVEDAPDRAVAEANELLREMGSFDYALEKAREYAYKAKKSLELFPESSAKRDLLEMVDYFVERNY